ncbi:retinaldehyde-binding protein 1-like [Pieris napi]|uniref:retinaldehyde-binding protein 1-like n=1 Tax=Pieris napi TaxID=78633 RepID=UPI001FBC13E4|nr:retinaldehyde-binding protein 1-like [Pieris napi]
MVLGEVQQFSLEEEYKKKNGISSSDVQELRQWLKTQPHLPEKYITDLDLIFAYHSCERSSGVTKQVLDLHYTLRTLFTNFFKNRRVEDVEQICNTALICPLPTRTKEGYAIFYSHMINYDPKLFVFSAAVKATLMVVDLWQYEEGTWPGFCMVVDFKGMSLGHLARIDLQSLQQFLYYLQETMLVRFKGMHFVNAPSWVDKLVMMMKPFMKKELMEMLRVHTTGSDTLQQWIPIEGLPKDSGGTYKTILECKDDVLKKLLANKAFFENENNKRVTEALRKGKAKTISDIFGGLEGSFKKLEID